MLKLLSCRFTSQSCKLPSVSLLYHHNNFQVLSVLHPALFTSIKLMYKPQLNLPTGFRPDRKVMFFTVLLCCRDVAPFFTLSWYAALMPCIYQLTWYPRIRRWPPVITILVFCHFLYRNLRYNGIGTHFSDLSYIVYSENMIY